mgnify:CR=1 FL=1
MSNHDNNNGNNGIVPFKPTAQISTAAPSDPGALRVLCRVFEGNPFNTLLWRGEPVWICVHVGRWLEYSDNGNRLARKILGEWSGEFQDGQHYHVLSGPALSEFKEFLSKIGQSDDSPDRAVVEVGEMLRVNRLLLLTELGFYKVCMKSGKPVGSRLMDFAAGMLREYRTGGALVVAPAPAPLPFDPTALRSEVVASVRADLLPMLRSLLAETLFGKVEATVRRTLVPKADPNQLQLDLESQTRAADRLAPLLGEWWRIHRGSPMAARDLVPLADRLGVFGAADTRDNGSPAVSLGMMLAAVSERLVGTWVVKRRGQVYWLVGRGGR